MDRSSSYCLVNPVFRVLIHFPTLEALLNSHTYRRLEDMASNVDAGRGQGPGAAHQIAGPHINVIVRAGVAGGLSGAIIIWIYKALVGAQHLMPLAGAAECNWPRIRQSIPGIDWHVGRLFGTAIYFVFAILWWFCLP